MGLWDVKTDEEREDWAFSPFVSVGPLRFGMTHDEVLVALGCIEASMTRRGARFGHRGVTTYYTAATGLACVAIDALNGPQVCYDRTPLVGKVPSTLEQWVLDYTEAHGLELSYTEEGNAKSRDLGFIVRVQRAGDVVLTRPVFMIRDWTDDPWHDVPEAEWSTF